MNWMRDYVRPTLRAVFKRSDDSEEVKWHSCKKCGQMIYRRDFVAAQHVCPQCDHHERIGPPGWRGVGWHVAGARGRTST